MPTPAMLQSLTATSQRIDGRRYIVSKYERVPADHPVARKYPHMFARADISDHELRDAEQAYRLEADRRAGRGTLERVTDTARAALEARGFVAKKNPRPGKAFTYWTDGRDATAKGAALSEEIIDR